MRTTAEAKSAELKQLRIAEAADLKGRPKASSDAATLYTHVLCPYAQRAWLVLLEKVSRSRESFNRRPDML